MRVGTIVILDVLVQVNIDRQRGGKQQSRHESNELSEEVDTISMRAAEVN